MKKKRNAKDYTPVNDQVIVKIRKEASKTAAAGILIPDSVGYVEKGGEGDFYKVDIIKYTGEAEKINPGLKEFKYGLVSIYSGSYLMTQEGSYKIIPAFMLVAMTNDEKFSAKSIKPTANRILVKEQPISETTESGIIVGEDYRDPREKETLEGEILGVGPLSKQDLPVGKTVVYDPYVGNVLPRLTDAENEIKYKVVHEHDIFVIY
jgi:co-chaperonin GroES (HSP10)